MFTAPQVWRLNREGIEVAKCTVRQLMTKLGLSGTTAKSPQDHVADRPQPVRRSRPAYFISSTLTWVADLTCVDLGRVSPTWPLSPTPTSQDPGPAGRFHDGTSMVLDAIEQTIWTRQQEGVLDPERRYPPAIGDLNLHRSVQRAAP